MVVMVVRANIRMRQEGRRVKRKSKKKGVVGLIEGARVGRRR